MRLGRPTVKDWGGLLRSPIRPALICLVAWLCAVASANAGKGHAFEVRGWDIEKSMPQYVYEMIDKAKKYDINTIGLSHSICMTVEEILDDEGRSKQLEAYCRYAHKRGMKVYLWTHEVNGPVDKWFVTDKDGRTLLNLDDPALYECISKKYRDAIEKVPSCDGFILSLTESRIQAHRPGEAVSKMTPAERMAKVINAVREGCAVRRGGLIVRDFLRNPAEMDAFLEALKSVPDDVWVYTKCVPNDWEFRYPPHPLIGKVAPHKQIMEMDLATEVGGITHWPMCCPEYIQKYVRMARDKGLAGAIPRCDDQNRSNVGTPNEINVVAYSILINDPDADVNKIWRDFCVRRYGEKAAPAAEKALRRSFDITCDIAYTLGFWITKMGQVSPGGYADIHLIENSNALWDPSPENKRIEKMLLDSGPEAIRATVDEKIRAERLSRQCLKELDEAKDLFKPVDYKQLRGCYKRTLRGAQIGRHWTRIYFALRWYRNTKSQEAKAELDAALADARRYTKEIADTPEDVSAESLNQFIADVEAEIATVQSP